MRKYKILFLLLIFPFLLSGCWDYDDIDKRSIVISIGVDKIYDKIQFATELAKLYARDGGDGKAAISDIHLDMAEGENFEKTRDEFEAKRPYGTFLGATRVVVFGENYAKEGIEPYLNRINETYDYRKTVLAVVCRGNPYEIFQTNIKNDISAGFLIEHIINSLFKTGNIMYTRVGDMISDLQFKDIGFAMPYFGVEDNSLECIGAAIMKDAKLIDVLYRKKDHDLFKGLIFLVGKPTIYTEETTIHKDDKNTISFISNLKNRKISIEMSDNKQVIINIDLNFDLKLQYQYYNEIINNDDIKNFEIDIARDIKSQVRKILNKSQKEYQCDIFDFARYAKAQNPNEYKNINWLKKYPNAKININVVTNIVNKNLKDINALSKGR
ncbi:Ger(x)C family spore germination protein [Haloimpatiens lingqiaonensis]|uniref:Ger(x)C family spore germination protein n=1 Tax=Haloimpatiens lingqiaonensis TaxID=1380675 RepID=UPI0010FD9CF4|nr:Ger(x)C family spore germination protein [Haloimpatiens lingqiaonensis]